MKRISLSKPLRLALYYCAGATSFLARPAAQRRQSFHVDGRIDTHIDQNSNDGEDTESDRMQSGDVSALLGGTLRRADRTLSSVSEARETIDDASDDGRPRDLETVRDLVRGIQQATSSRNDQNTGIIKQSKGSKPGSPSFYDTADQDDLINYGSNPTITMTALAHVLWKSIIRPGKDSAIDATAGNGGDAMVLAELMFPPMCATEEKNENYVSHLVCIDIQQSACEATKSSLSKVLSDYVMRHHVTIHHTSHAPLIPPPPEAGPVALVAYNLGYLPGQERSTEATTVTQSSTTLTSLADAVIYLRVGGLLSVMTYPQTNSLEDASVQAFVEGLALFSSQSHNWQDFLVEAEPLRYPALDGDDARREIRQRLQYVHEELGARQCWRVHVHEKLGWVNAPRLLTATRVR